MNYKIAIIATIMVIAAAGLCTISADASSDEADSIAIPRNIAIISIDEPSEMNTRLDGTTQIVTSVSDISSISSGTKAVILDTAWIDATDSTTVSETIDSLVADHKVVVSPSVDVFTNDDSSITMTGFSSSASLYSYYYDPVKDSNVCCSFEGSTFESSVRMLTNWINDNTDTLLDANRIDAVNAAYVGSGLAQWGTELATVVYKECDDYGDMNISTCYYPLMENNPDYNYYYTRYHVQTVPDDNRYTCDIRTSTQLISSHKILQYAPTTSPETSTVGVNLGVSSDGVISAGVSWSYSIGSVTVHDESNEKNRLFSIWHDVDETKNVGSDSYYVEPGKLVRVTCVEGTKTGNYVGSDHYEVNFAKKVKTGIFGQNTKYEIKTFSTDVGVICKTNPHTMTIYINGADEYIYHYEDPGYDFTQPRTQEVSDGGYVTLYEPDVTKTNCTFIGYATNPNATTAEYQTGESIKMFNDMSLYMIWEEA